MSVYCLSSLIL